jgi:hypothetical protein
MGFEGDLEGFLRDFVGLLSVRPSLKLKKEALIRASI